jgi:hypothetical protein
VSGPTKGKVFRLGPFAVGIHVGRVQALKRLVLSDEEVLPPSLAPQTPEEQYRADRADGRRGT